MPIIQTAGRAARNVNGRVIFYADAVTGSMGRAMEETERRRERQHAHKPAGLRTNILICVGAALLTDLSVTAAGAAPGADPARIAAQIVTGVGFLGAGTILQARGSVTGLTTAATLWVVAAIGMAVGFGAAIELVTTVP